MNPDAGKEGGGRLAGFWIRLAADLLDALVLGLLGMLLVQLFRGPIGRLGERGVFIGLAVSLLYSGVLHSHLGGGRTLAKRFFNLQVVRLDGSLLSLDRSLVRYAIMACLVYGSAVAYAVLALAPVLPTGTVLAVLAGIQLALFLGCALLIPFHPLKRGLHDILAGTIVIRGGMPPAQVIQQGHRLKRDRHLVMAAGLVALLAVGGMLGFTPGQDRLAPAFRVMQAMEDLGIQNPGINYTFNPQQGRTHRTIQATGFIPESSAGQAPRPEVHRQILSIIRQHMPLSNVDEIGTVLRTGVNIGIYSRYQTSKHSEPVGELTSWR